mmetsp:Transcript_25583/g.33468  ORF Transcript_25583/g.33468 Transcript_25583/m.33468 type:complete len:659 (+) Transcript_25583:112-2088(+)
MNRSTKVIIVGAGPVGLSLSILLSRANVRNIVVERNENFKRQKHPQAHFLNFRTMEIFRNSFGNKFWSNVISKSQPVEKWRDFIYCSSVLGREFARVNNFTGGNSPSCLEKLSPVSVCHLSQSKLHPLLLDQAQKLGAELLMGSEISEIKENMHRISMRVQTAASKDTVLESAYLAACDGAHSTTRGMLGLELQHISLDQQRMSSGTSQTLGNLVNIHFSCPELAKYLIGDRRPGMLYFVYNQELVAVMVAHDIASGDWVCQVPYFPPHQTQEQDFDEGRCIQLIQSAIGTQSLPVTINSVRTWSMKACVANRFQSAHERAFLVGDAAHQFPPAGGFGLNTGIQDAHNLAWKLKAVCEGYLPSDFLKTYDQERRLIAIQNTKLSLQNYERTLRTSRALGIDPAHPELLQQMVLDPKRGKEIFSAGLKFGLAHLGALSEHGHPYAEKRIADLHQVLQQGSGLPLLFPRHDIGFRYPLPNTQNGNQEQQLEDHPQKLRIGARFPHFRLVAFTDTGAPSLFSTVDLGAQISLAFKEVKETAYFVLLVLHHHNNNKSDVLEKEYEEDNMFFLPEYFTKVPIFVVHVKEQSRCYNDLNDLQRMHSVSLLAREVIDQKKEDEKICGEVHAYDFENSIRKAFSEYKNFPKYVLIRPDGHIEWMEV